MGNQAVTLHIGGDLEGAIALYKEQERICRQLDRKDYLATSLANQASLLARYEGRPQQALPLAQEAYRLATDHGLATLTEWIQPILEDIRSRVSSASP